ncbi:MAG: DNA polymerase IV [Ignavibacteria bacterium]|nr:DNA polymerase IV [Ignavibacteria bacterium]
MYNTAQKLKTLPLKIANNSIREKEASRILFIDMNSFFATVEQQYNYWLRGRPVGVCVYTGRFGCIISPSREAKLAGVKTGMRLNDAVKICPDIVPVETRPDRYREIHVKLIKLLRRFSDVVIPKSIDEAVVDMSNHMLHVKDLTSTAMEIKRAIKEEIGDYLTCSIGIAPNAFLAKFAANIKKPDGLTVLTRENIDELLQGKELTDLPGISYGIANRLKAAGIHSPVELRHSTPQKLKSACNSIIGIYWYYRLNFSEVDQMNERYKSMQAMRQISKEQRKSVDTLNQLFLTLCLQLEKRMVKDNVFCNEIGFFARYENGFIWKDHIITAKPVQDGVEIMNMIKSHMEKYSEKERCGPVINNSLVQMGVTVQRLVHKDMVQFELFGRNVSKDYLRKTVYDIKDKYGSDRIMRAIELRDEKILKDVIGFGSVKDLHDRYVNDPDF